MQLGYMQNYATVLKDRIDYDIQKLTEDATEVNNKQ